VKKPAHYMELNTLELSHHINELNIWNADQPVSDKEHKRHYLAEIAPLVKRHLILWLNWEGKHSK